MATRQYGKIVEGQIQYAPSNITVDNVTYKPATDEALVEAGYKIIAYAPYPDDGNEYELSWKETADKIQQMWNLAHELTPAERRERAYTSEDCCVYGEKNYTVDALEELYYKYFAEDGKEELCAEIKAAITAGKAHIREEYPDTDSESEE